MLVGIKTDMNIVKDYENGRKLIKKYNMNPYLFSDEADCEKWLKECEEDNKEFMERYLVNKGWKDIFMYGDRRTKLYNEFKEKIDNTSDGYDFYDHNLIFQSKKDKNVIFGIYMSYNKNVIENYRYIAKHWKTFGIFNKHFFNYYAYAPEYSKKCGDIRYNTILFSDCNVQKIRKAISEINFDGVCGEFFEI